MAQTSNSIVMLKNRLIAEMSRDKKKAVLLAVLLLVMAFVVGKLIFTGSPAEATAAANLAPKVDPSTPEPPGQENIAAAITKAKPPKAGKPKPAAKGITRDIFMPDLSVFPRTAANAKSGGSVDVVEDEKTRRDAERKRREALIREQAAELHLESTITGKAPNAIINGSVLGRGGVISGFRIIEINSQACIVEKDGVKLNLTME